MSAAYGWQNLYRDAVLETATTKRRHRIVEAHLAIQQRLAEGLSREKDSTELVAIDNALAGLRVLLTIESADPEV
jgi:hypothetical protein